jgi:single-stranded-DNA-specific exonuclease
MNDAAMVSTKASSTALPHRKRWRLCPQDAARAGGLAKALGVPQTVGQLLLNRGVQDEDAGRKFLERRLSSLTDPRLLPGCARAAEIIVDAIRDGKSICIYGDYDVDGMCATAILLECLRVAGAKASFYVPDRLDEGYGVNAQALRNLREDKQVDLVVTVDCGIASISEAEEAKRLGLRYVVTDHHQPKHGLPDADAIVHPCLPGHDYCAPYLCGAGVAYKLAWQVARLLSGGERVTDEFRALLMEAVLPAALATVCDLVPMQGENRILVHHGLGVLHRSPPLGLHTLLRYANIGEKARLTTGDLGFTLGPRLNACGRLGTARLGVELLTTRDPSRASKLAEYLEEQNKQRQLLERRMILRARELAERQYKLDSGGDASAIVLADDYAPDKWHPGVIGIVAGRLADRYHRPCLLVAFNGDAGSGSGRSISTFDLHCGITECQDHLVTAGGHAMAVGFRVERDRFDAFRAAFERIAEEQVCGEAKVGELRLDAEVSMPSITPPLLRSMEVLEPFGLGNPSPMLLATNLKVVGEPRKVGGGERHLSFTVQDAAGGPVRKAIGFDLADRLDELLSDGGRCCLAFTLLANEFRGQTSVDLRIHDLRPGPTLES